MLEILELQYVMIPIIVFLGLIFGSFATAVAYRVPIGQQFITGRSKCPSCGHILNIIDLFPVFSWLFLKGKCRYCKTKFGSSYILIETGLALMFLVIYLQMGVTIQAGIMALIAIVIIILIAIDFEHYIIPDGVNLWLFLLCAAYSISIGSHWLYFIIGPLTGLATGLFLRWLIRVWKKQEGLGMGDVKFLIAAGVILTIEMVDFFLFLSGVIGVLTAIIWKALGKGERFPFGPSLSIALFISVLFPQWATSWRDFVESIFLELL